MQVTNEMGVVVLFAQQCDANGYKLLSIQPNYPDAIIEKDGTQYRAEFEYRASNFRDHRHDPRECDIIVCWENDASESVLPVLAISETGWGETKIELPGKWQREAVHWKQRAMYAEGQLSRLETQLAKLTTETTTKPANTVTTVHVCPNECGRSFGSQQALAAHSRHCNAQLVAQQAIIPINDIEEPPQ